MGDFYQILPVTDVKRDLLALIKKVQKMKESIAITRNGRPTAVLLSLEEYEGLLETIEILSDPALLKTLRKSRKELDAGKFVTHREVWEK
jgi:prevent-host-death family protein